MHFQPNDTYAQALEAEKRMYAQCEQVHNLPPAFHYWSNRHLRPLLREQGFDSPDALFLKIFSEQCGTGLPVRFLSIGAGNGDLELQLACQLSKSGYDNFVIDCLELNPQMLERGRVAADAAGLAKRFDFIRADFNHWTAGHQYDAVMANQSLHHVMNLEGLFGEIQRSLRASGAFVISDMIGRNGHRRWPEALRLVREFWRTLPPSYRQNQLLGAYEEEFADWDCSGEGFEGVRAQDILPQLLERFHFESFLPFANLIDPFIDRAFGHHFNVDSAWDRAFLDRVHARDVEEIAAGRLTPTHLLAVMRQQSDARTLPAEALRRYVRHDNLPWPKDTSAHGGAYEWSAWPHPAQKELEIACARLADVHSKSARLIDERTAWALSLQADLDAANANLRRGEQELAQRTAWARGLELETAKCRGYLLQVEQELEERTAWAHRLRDEAASIAAIAQLRLEEVEARTAWAHNLDAELEECGRQTLRLQEELRAQTEITHDLQRHPYRHAARHLIHRVKQRT